MDEWQREPDLGKYSQEAIAARQSSRELAEQSPDTEVEAPSVMEQIGDWASGLKAKVLQQEQMVAEQRSDQQYSLTSPFAGSSPRTFSPIATVGLLVVAVLVARWLWGLLKMIQWGGGAKKKGRYVRDRGLGGKMVFIEDEGEVPPHVPGNASPVSPDPVSERTEAQDPWQAGVARQKKEEEKEDSPPWWSPPPTIYIDPAYKAQAKEDAQAVANRMINTKAASGQEYDLASLVSLRQICGESGVTVSAKTQRDTIFRRAVEMAATCAEDQTNSLGGQPPSKFVSGLAVDLGIPEKEAFNMVHGVVTAKARQTLIAACASYRENKNNDIMIQLLKLTGLLTALPLPEGSAQAELVAKGLERAATLNERRAIFLTYGCMTEERSAALVAELMGFHPDLVLPQLQDHIQKGRTQSRATPAPA